jgi:hypothetical protein
MLKKSLNLLVVGITLLAAGRAAQAADCQLRALQFVGIVNDGRLVINAEMWDGATGAKVGWLGNVSYCQVNTTFNGISPQTCQAWQSIATAAMLAGKKVYVNASSCPAGNGIALPGLSMLGLNN